MHLVLRTVAVGLVVSATVLAASYGVSLLLPMEPGPREMLNVLAVLVSLLIPVFTYYAAQFTRLMMVHFGETRRGQFRPYLATFLEKEDEEWFLTVQAWGHGMARDVRLRLEGALFDAYGRDIRSFPLFTDTLDVLPPGKCIRIRLRPSVSETTPSMPSEITVRVRYKDFYVEGREYSESFILRPPLLELVQHF